MQNAGGGPGGVGGSHENVLKWKVGCDVTFEVGPAKEIISCNKIFLIARSSVFEVMFEDRWTNNHQMKGVAEIIKLPDVESKIFQSFLVFIYTDYIDPANMMSCMNIEKLLYLAEKYDVLKLKNRCEEKLRSMLEMLDLELNNAILIHSIANLYSLIQLSANAEYMMTKKVSELILNPSFLNMDAAVLARIVASDDTAVNELELFHALMKWSEFQCEKLQLEPSGDNLRSVLGPILGHIRFPLIERLAYYRYVVPRNILTEKEKSGIFDYIHLKRDSRLQFNPNRRKAGTEFKAERIYSECQEMQSTRGPGTAESHLNLLERKVRCDVTFEVGRAKEIISCHKIFLIARSCLFEIMFDDRWANHGNKRVDQIISIPDVESGSFQSFLKFIYADLIEPADLRLESVPTVKDLLYLAEKYNVFEFRNRCEEMFLSMLAVNNVLQIHPIAEQFSLVRLLATAEHKITSEFWRIIWDASFLTTDVTLLTRFVASDDTNVDELNLFNALMNWSQYQCEKLKLKPSGKNLRAVLGPILAHIRFPLMGTWKFFKYVAPTKILTTQEKLDIFGYTRLARKDRDNFDVSGLGFKVHARKGFLKQM